ncbi:MAG: SusC/RagA family TonB-linked outer membrane protein [Bacteroidota bacterium]
MKRIPLILFLSLLTLPAFAQQTIMGKVLDRQQQPIVDVLVKVKGHSLETRTSPSGTFQLFTPKNATLLLSKQGFRNQKIKVKSSELSITLLPKKEEVVKEQIVSGKIIDGETNLPLHNASIIADQNGNQTQSDENGRFDLSVPLGSRIKVFHPYGITQFDVGPKESPVFTVYKTNAEAPLFGSQVRVEKEQFNSGNIHNPIQLVQGLVPGLQITRGGGNDLFGNFDVRNRGVTSFNARRFRLREILGVDEPLIVVDGMPEVDLSLIDPLSIASVKVIRDGTTAQYGVRGAGGVIEITTNGFSNNSNQIRYHSYLGIDRPHLTMQFLDAEGYRNLPSSISIRDRGSSTDWFDEVTQTAVSQVHQLTLTGGAKNTQYSISATYRNANSVLQQQDLDRLQFNGRLRQTALNKKVTLDAQLVTNNQDNNYSFPLAFRYAQTYNPTAPIFDENNSANGGYFEEQLFNYYNPVALLDQNERRGEQQNTLGRLGLQWEVAPSLFVNGRYQFAENDLRIFDYNSKQSFFPRGIDRNGYASQENSSTNNQLTDFSLSYRPNFDKISLQFDLGHQYQTFTTTSLYAAGGDFLTDAFGANNLSASGDFAQGRGIVTSSKNKHKIAAFYGNLALDWKAFTLNAGLRREGSSRLGSNNRWGNFPYAALNVNTAQLWGGFFYQNNVQFRASYGVAGHLPSANGLASPNRLREAGNFLQNGVFRPYYDFDFSSIGNPNLKWEETATVNLGVTLFPTLFNQTVRFELDYFQSRSDDLILPVRRETARFPNDLSVYGTTYENSGALKSHGLEGSIRWQAMQKDNFSWETGLLFAHNITTISEYLPEDAAFQSDWLRIASSPTNGGCCKTETANVSNGTRVGSIWVPEFQQINEAGQFIYKDQNGDRWITKEDYIAAGNGLPDLTLSWVNTLKWGSFDAQFLWEGAFGHQNFNITRKLGENPNAAWASNILASTAESDAIRLTDFPEESSRYIENASYFRLNNLTIGYSFAKFRTYFTGQNLLTFTGYKGWDPAVRLDSFGDVLGAGYDYRKIFLPTRSFVFGVELTL